MSCNLIVTMHKSATVASRIAQGSSEAKCKLIWALWTIFISKASSIWGGLINVVPNSIRCDSCKTALGVSEEVAANGLKGNKKKRAKRLDEDFNVSHAENTPMRAKLDLGLAQPVLKPMSSQDVPKIVAALRQATANRPMLVKILQRIQVRLAVLMAKIGCQS
jgi:hypothetical protein